MGSRNQGESSIVKRTRSRAALVYAGEDASERSRELERAQDDPQEARSITDRLQNMDDRQPVQRSLLHDVTRMRHSSSGTYGRSSARSRALLVAARYAAAYASVTRRWMLSRSRACSPSRPPSPCVANLRTTALTPAAVAAPPCRAPASTRRPRSLSKVHHPP